MVHDGEETERFSTLTLAYMSGESSVDEASGTISQNGDLKVIHILQKATIVTFYKKYRHCCYIVLELHQILENLDKSGSNII